MARIKGEFQDSRIGQVFERAKPMKSTALSSDTIKDWFEGNGCKTHVGPQGTRSRLARLPPPTVMRIFEKRGVDNATQGPYRQAEQFPQQEPSRKSTGTRERQ
jgi:hypothetical protein